MAQEELAQLLAAHPVIAAVRDVNDMELAIHSPVKAIFLMCGDIVNNPPLNDLTVCLKWGLASTKVQ